jgi:hypothetical protein
MVISLKRIAVSILMSVLILPLATSYASIPKCEQGGAKNADPSQWHNMYPQEFGGSNINWQCICLGVGANETNNQAQLQQFWVLKPYWYNNNQSIGLTTKMFYLSNQATAATKGFNTSEGPMNHTKAPLPWNGFYSTTYKSFSSHNNCGFVNSNYFKSFPFWDTGDWGDGKNALPGVGVDVSSSGMVADDAIVEAAIEAAAL